MKNKNKRFMFVAIVCFAIMGNNLFGCMTTFINDSNNQIAILNECDKSFRIMPKNDTFRFGDPSKHAQFVIYTIQNKKSPYKKSQLWIPAYSCQQNECGTKGNVALKLSDVENCTEVTRLFTITKHKPYASMVNKLPMIQKKSCHCNCP
jgi:hypothetical protein